MIFDAIALANLLNRCAPSADPRIFASIARVESPDPRYHGLPNSNAIHDNVTGASYYFATQQAAVARARALLRRGYGTIDLGLVQVNSSNLAGLGMTVESAFDPCTNVSKGLQILKSGWRTALDHIGPSAGLYRLMYATASEYNSNTLGGATAYIRAFSAAYNSQFVRAAAYYAYMQRADAARPTPSQRARLVAQSLAAVNLAAPPPSPRVARPANTEAPSRQSRRRKKKTVTTAAARDAADGFQGDWRP